jgi:hypothetical protein
MTVAANVPSARTTQPSFYVWMAAACAIVAFIGFAPTYWAPHAQGSFRGSALVHIHGALFFTWPLFVVYQTWLVSSGRIVSHRDVGLIGIALATAMTLLGITVAIVASVRFMGTGVEAETKAFLIVPLSVAVFFAITVGVAIANVRRPEWHKRLMMVATVSLLEAAIARWFLTFLAPPDAPPGPPPVSVALLPALLGDLLIVTAIVFDWRSRGRPHPAYLTAGGALLAVQVLREPLSRTHVWDSIATWLVSIGG